MTESYGQVIGGILGKVLEVDVDDNGRNSGKFFRIKVVVMCNKPLRRYLMIKPKGRAIAERFDLKYERVPHFCFYCGVMGHTERDCTSEVKSSQVIRFGLDLRASPYKKFEHRRWTFSADCSQSATRNFHFSNFGRDRTGSSEASRKAAERSSPRRESQTSSPSHDSSGNLNKDVQYSVVVFFSSSVFVLLFRPSLFFVFWFLVLM